MTTEALRKYPNWVNAYDEEGFEGQHETTLKPEAFAAVVELVRTENRNPPVPAEIQPSYDAALKELSRIGFERVAAWGPDAFEPFMACLALSLGRRIHARAYLDLTESEIEEFDKYLERG